MAGVIGGAGGYATVGPTRNYIGEAMSNVQDSMFRQNAQRIADERTRIADEQNLQEQRRRDFNDSMEFSAKYPFIATGTSIDGANRQGVENAHQTYKEAQANYNKTGDKKYLAAAENALASINNLNEMPKALALKMEEWQKNESGYSASSMTKKKSILDKMAKGDLMQENDENGRAVYTLVDRDENGNVSKILYSKLNSKQIMDLLTVEPKFDISGEKGLLAQFKKRIATPVKEKKEVNGKVIETTYVPNAESVAKIMANEMTKDHSAVYATLEELSLDPNDESNYSNPKILQQVTSSLEKTLTDSAPKSISEETNWQEKNYNASQKQHSITNANEATRIKIAQEGSKSGGRDYTVTQEEGGIMPVRRVTSKMTKEELDADNARIQAEKNNTAKPKESNDVWNNPITAGIKKAFSGKAKTTTKAELKAKADALRKKYAPKK